MSRRSFLGTGLIAVFNSNRWAIGLELVVTIEKIQTLKSPEVTTVADCSDFQTVIGQSAHLEPGQGQRPARRINWSAQKLLTNSLETGIHWVPGQSGILEKEETERRVDLGGDA
jgi:hypothetical protein